MTQKNEEVTQTNQAPAHGGSDSLNKGMEAATVQKSADADADDAEKEKEKEDKMDKSIDPTALDATVDMLQKSISGSTANRQQELLKKGSTSGLSTEEREELVKSLSGADSTGAADVTAPLEGNEDLNKSLELDVTGFLNGVHEGLIKSLTTLTERLDKGFKAQEDNDYVLAKAMLDICKVVKTHAALIKSTGDKVDSFGRQPAAGPRAAQSAQQASALRKGFGPSGQPEGVNRLSRNMILDTLHEMSLEKSMSPSQSERYSRALAAGEHTGHIDNEVVREVIAYRQQKQ